MSVLLHLRAHGPRVGLVALALYAALPRIHLDTDSIGLLIELCPLRYAHTTLLTVYPVDPDTAIVFPKTISVPSQFKTPPLSLVGLGVRTVSFLGIKVYSIGFYADLSSPNLNIPLNMPPDEKINHIVRNTACLLRIVPTRTTSYTHLRDAFMRALHARLARDQAAGTLSDTDALAVAGPLRALKTLFPNSPLAKHFPLDVYAPAPVPGQPRPLIFRDLGAVQSSWVATELLLHYFDGKGASPPLKNTTVARLESFQTT
ncbi:chalcone-flavanone isomerase-domain-containing protein [Mycena sp. CBHHK59/15]|nr:chalcone-flavanone isomerase-domain-containing protein [Mycena sp. CBHHK59/15]